MIIAGDIGGTKARIGLYERRAGKVELIISDQYASKDYQSLEAILEEFLQSHSHAVSGRLEAACFGLPGPVINGTIKVTNLPWEVVQSHVGNTIGVTKIKLVNDLVSTAAAIPRFEPSSLVPLFVPKGETDTAASCAVVAPGTGIGHSLIHREGGWSVLLASEGGHANFAPTNELEIELLRYLLTRLPHVSVESVLCGPGIVNIYSFLKDTGHGSSLPQDDEPGAIPVSASVIAGRAIEGSHDLSSKTMDMFCSMLGAHCSNIAFTYLATGGIYLGGGIPPKIISILNNGSFAAGYLQKDKQREMIEATPVFVISDDYAALHGSAAIAATL